MSGKSERGPLFERLKTGLEDGIRFSRGELALRTHRIPDRPPEIAAETIATLRQRLAMSQTAFARLLNVSPRTVKCWEQGTRSPSQAALRLLQVLSEQPEVVLEVAGIERHG